MTRMPPARLGPLALESYIVRIYRREVGKGMAGVLEEAFSRRARPFHSLAELVQMLRRPPRAVRALPAASAARSTGTKAAPDRRHR